LHYSEDEAKFFNFKKKIKNYTFPPGHILHYLYNNKSTLGYYMLTYGTTTAALIHLPARTSFREWNL